MSRRAVAWESVGFGVGILCVSSRGMNYGGILQIVSFFVFLVTCLAFIALIISLSIYQWPYGPFGEKKRRRPPNETMGTRALSVRPICFGLQWFHCWIDQNPIYSLYCKPKNTVSLMEEGLVICLYFYGDIFIPWTEVESAERKGSWCDMAHSSPEVRSPIIFKDKSGVLFEGLKRRVAISNSFADN